jgi:CheY-like chemotaxis protein
MQSGDRNGKAEGLGQRAVRGEALLSVNRPQIQILAVDDSQEMTTQIEDYLSDPSVGVTIANTGKQAVEIFGKRSFDLILLDIKMPEMDGYEVCAALRQIEEEQVRTKTPIMALTADSDMLSSYMILRSGFDLHLVKPILRVTLLQIVGQFQGKRNVDWVLSSEGLEDIEQIHWRSHHIFDGTIRAPQKPQLHGGRPLMEPRRHADRPEQINVNENQR